MISGCVNRAPSMCHIFAVYSLIHAFRNRWLSVLQYFVVRKVIKYEITKVIVSCIFQKRCIRYLIVTTGNMSRHAHSRHLSQFCKKSRIAIGLISRFETYIYKKVAVRSILKCIEQILQSTTGRDSAHSKSVTILRVYHRYELFVIGYVVHHDIIRYRRIFARDDCGKPQGRGIFGQR